MKIIIDINHPADVHCFRNLAKLLEKKGHKILFVTRDRFPCIDLLDHYKLTYVNRGKGSDTFIGKFIGIFKFDMFYVKLFYKFKPNIIISFSTPYPHHIAKLFRIPNIALNDTEHSDKLHKKITYPFCDTIITPFNYKNKLGKKHIRVNSLIESIYIKQYDEIEKRKIRKKYSIGENEKVFFFRFTAGTAHHDSNFIGLTHNYKTTLLNRFKKLGKVFVSMEDQTNNDYSGYKVKIKPEEMHKFMAICDLFITDSGTMASECALMGVPVIYTNNLPLMCYLKYEQDRGLLFHRLNESEINQTIDTILPEILIGTRKYLMIVEKMESEFINLNNLMVWFIENYPNSAYQLRKDPQYQNKFNQ